ncbi:hypothetical protein L6452_02319 [Arctium lappa]|uniref:Uncharacterized protein n=1 Tax=Arctium lappa TaxID=4217 RepID=A0ACB9FKD3_ARCLA|nr:hypothetical protein L6452_02319 [Arctium lappa]
MELLHRLNDDDFRSVFHIGGYWVWVTWRLLVRDVRLSMVSWFVAMRDGEVRKSTLIKMPIEIKIISKEAMAFRSNQNTPFFSKKNKELYWQRKILG